jgi:aminoglycoside phosphotransferase (APT) family kinase protein
MVRMHRIDVASTGIAALGKPEGFVARQVQGWAERWQRSKTEELPDMDRVIDRLAARTPASIPPTLVHNDFKLDNVMLRANSLDRVEAVLDWEMTTVGDPLADVGLTLCYWSWASAPQLGAMMVPTITSQPGWYTRERFIQHYAKSTGRDVSQIGYYEVLGIFKLAVIVQQIFYRFARGQTQDQRFRNFDQRVKGLAHLAATVAEKYC